MDFLATFIFYLITIPAVLFGTAFGLDLLLGGIAEGLRQSRRNGWDK